MSIMFCGRYFHQTKWTAMGTPMTVNYGNCFMGHFETDLLQDYKKKIRKKPTLWHLIIYLLCGLDLMQNLAILSSFARTIPVVKIKNQKSKLLHLNYEKLQFCWTLKLTFKSTEPYLQTYFVNQ